MPWPDREWAGFCLLLDEWWKDDLPDSAEAAWKLALDDVEPAEAVATLKQVLRQGATWRPSCAEFIAALEVRGNGGVLSFDEVWPVVVRGLQRGRPGDLAPVVEYVRENAGDHAAGWVAAYGVDRLMGEPTDDPDYGGAVVKRLRDSYRELTASPGGRDRLVRALDEAPRRQGLHRFDPALALPEATT